MFCMKWPGGGTAAHWGFCCQPGHSALSSRGVCLCCVLSCLPSRLWVIIHTPSQVQLQGTVPVPASSLARLECMWVIYGCVCSAGFSFEMQTNNKWLVGGLLKLFILWALSKQTESVVSVKTRRPRGDFNVFSSVWPRLIFHVQGCKRVFVPESITCMHSEWLNKKRQHFSPTREQIAFSLSARRKQSNRKLPWKIARPEWLSSDRGPRLGEHVWLRAYKLGEWPTERMALWLMATPSEPGWMVCFRCRDKLKTIRMCSFTCWYPYSSMNQYSSHEKWFG